MRLLFLSTYFQPQSASTGILMTSLAEQLAERGHKITVITSVPHYDENKILDEYKGKLYVKEKMGALDVRRVYIYVSQKKTNILGRILNYISFNVLSFIACLFSPRPDVIFVPSPPLTNGVAGAWLAKVWRVPFVYNLQDIYPDVAVKLGVLTNKRVIHLFTKMESYVYDRAKVVSVISPSFARNLIAKNVPCSKLALIPNFVDADLVKPMERENDFRRENGLLGKFVILFSGNVGLSQGLESVIDAAKQLSELEDVVLLINGDGSTKQSLIEYAQSIGASNVKFLPFQPMSKVPQVYAASNVCVVPLKKGLTQDSVPCKLWSIMGAGRPVVAAVDPESDTAAVVREAGAGFSVPPEDSQAIACAIRKIYSDADQAEKLGLKGRDYVQQHYTLLSVADRYEALFNSLKLNKPHEVGYRCEDNI